jgi:acyl carrier protein
MTFEKVAEILADYKGIDVGSVQMESTFAELELDSLDVAELVMSLEDEFSVTIELDETVKTVADLVARIDGEKANA